MEKKNDVFFLRFKLKTNNNKNKTIKIIKYLKK